MQQAVHDLACKAPVQGVLESTCRKAGVGLTLQIPGLDGGVQLQLPRSSSRPRMASSSSRAAGSWEEAVELLPVVCPTRDSSTAMASNRGSMAAAARRDIDLHTHSHNKVLQLAYNMSLRLARAWYWDSQISNKQDAAP